MVYSDGEKFYHIDPNGIMLGSRLWGVLNGLQVTENSPPDMNVIVTAGSAIINATEITKDTSTTVPVDPADATYDRWDIVVINDAGTIDVTPGTPAANPLPPDIPANNILLALVYVAAGVTQITNANIYDRRLFIEKIKNVHVDDAAGIAESKLSLNYPTHPKLHAADHGSGGVDEVSLDASQITTGTLSLDRIPSTLTGKDADLWDGKHRSDNQTIGGDVQIGGNLSVDGYGYFKLYGDEQLRLNNVNSLANSLIGIKFSGKDNAGNPQPYGYIYCKILDSTNGSEDAQFEWWLYRNGSKTKQMYLTNSGNLYVDGSYNQFSPEVGDTEEEIIGVLKGEVFKEKAPRDSEGRLICPVCGKPNCAEPEHILVLEREYGKDVGKIALAAGKLVLKIYEKLKTFEEKLQ